MFGTSQRLAFVPQINTVLLLGAPMQPTWWVKILTYLQSEQFLFIIFYNLNLLLLLLLLLSSLLIDKFDSVIIIIIIIFITITTQMLQIASFLYFVCVSFTHAHLVIGPRAVELA
jgi:hypothetical protein